MKILLTLAAGIALLAIAGFQGSASEAAQNQVYAFGVTSQDPGCTEDGSVCLPFTYTYRALAVEHGDGHAWGLVSRFNHGAGVTRLAQVTCLTVADGKAAIGGIETAPGNDPFLLYVADRGLPGSSNVDGISPYAVFPPGDPDLTRLPSDFPKTCPSPDSIYSYFPQASGDVTVTTD